MARCRSGGVAFSVLVHTDMSSPWLTRYGTDEQKQKYLPGIVSGETVCALVITEPGTGSDMANLSTRAVRRGDRYLLTGSKIFITNGVYGDLYFVAARTAQGTAERRYDGISMFLVERDVPGFTVSRKLDKTGMRARHRGLAFHDCPVPAENLLRQGAAAGQDSSASASWRGAGARGAAQALGHDRPHPRAVAMSRSAASRRCATGSPTWRPRSRRRGIWSSRRDVLQRGRDCITEVSIFFATEVANRVAYRGPDARRLRLCGVPGRALLPRRAAVDHRVGTLDHEGDHRQAAAVADEFH
jgi:acyl-CoA dehydrogenase